MLFGRNNAYGGQPSVRSGKGLDTLFFLLFVIFGIYFINFFPIKYNFLNLPQALLIADNWIIFVAGILLILAAINHFRLNRLKKMTRGY